MSSHNDITCRLIGDNPAIDRFGVHSMSKSFSRIATIIGLLVIIYFCLSLIGTLAQLADAADRVHTGAGQPVFWILAAVSILLGLSPLYLYLRLPKPLIPPSTDDPEAIAQYKTLLKARLIENPHLGGMTITSDEEVEIALKQLSQRAEKIIRDTAQVVFASTAVMQNGRLDGVVVMVLQIRMVWRVASVFYGRPSLRQMIFLYSNVGANALLADSIQEIEFAEMTAPLVASTIPSLKGAIPGLQGIAALLVNSIASGTANAFLTLRVGCMASKYCASATRPEGANIRKEATSEAFSMVGGIARETGTRIVQSTWSAVKSVIEEAASSTMDGIKGAANDTIGKLKDMGDWITKPRIPFWKSPKTEILTGGGES